MCDLKFKRIFLAAILLAIFPGIAFAWFSIPGYNHSSLTSALFTPSIIDSNEYSDLYNLKDDLVKGSNSEAAHSKGGIVSGEYNGGDVLDWWNKKVLKLYNNFQFSEAYFHIGEIVHLTEDQAVPAHAANIYHAWEITNPLEADKFEYYAWKSLYSNPTDGYISGMYPDEYYQPVQKATRLNLPRWKNSNGVQYWNQAANAPSLDEDATMGDWGYYSGPPDYKDIFVSDLAILYSQTTEAQRAAVGVLKSASKKLPPLIKETTIEGGKSEQGAEWFVAGNNVKLTFKYYENRSAGVEINIFCNDKLIKHEDLAGGEYSIIPDANTYNITFPSPFPPGDPGRAYDVNVKVSIKDGDGNETIACTSFKSYVFYTFEYIQDKLGLGWGQDVMEVYSHTFSRMSGCGGGLEFTETTLGDLKAALHAGSTAPLAQSLWQCEGSYDPETCNQASVGCSGTPGWLGIGSTLFCFPPSESGTAPVAEEITADGITFSCLGIAPEITAPNALNVSLGPETNSATVTWNNDSVTDVNDTEFAIAGYNIYLGPDWDNPIGFVSVAGSTCSFELTNLSPTQKYEVTIRAKDARWNLGYMTDKKQFILAGPMTKADIGDPKYLSYISSSTPITFTVYDIYSHRVSAPTYYSLDNPAPSVWTEVSGPVFIPISGSHVIYFYSFYQGINEQPGHCQVFVDNVAPETSLIAGEVLDTKDKWQDSVKENVFLDEQGKIRLTPDEQYASKTDQNASGSGDWCETITDSLQKLAQSFKPTV